MSGDGSDGSGQEPRWDAYSAGTGSAEETSRADAPAPTERHPYAPYEQGLAASKAQATKGRTRLIVVISAVAVVSIAGFRVLGTVIDDVDTGGEDSGFAQAPVVPDLGEQPSDPPDLHSVKGFRDFLDAIEAEVGDAEVFEAVVYPEYAVVWLPVDDTTQRQRLYRYDGELEESDSPGTARTGRVDLSRVNVRVMLDRLDEVQTLVEEAETSYAIIEGADQTFGQKAAVRVYASNEYSETAYIETDLKGQERRRYLSDE